MRARFVRVDQSAVSDARPAVHAAALSRLENVLGGFVLGKSAVPVGIGVQVTGEHPLEFAPYIRVSIGSACQGHQANDQQTHRKLGHGRSIAPRSSEPGSLGLGIQGTERTTLC